eukprot:PhF_6_TR36820/c0_g1_i1/m.54126
MRSTLLLNWRCPGHLTTIAAVAKIRQSTFIAISYGTQLRTFMAPTRANLAPPPGEDGVFERYSEIDNSNEKRIKALRAAKLCENDDEWIGTEKVHGANF